MSNPIESRSVTVRNKHGLHMRPARLIADEAAKFQSDIEIVKDDGRSVDAKSLMLIMTLGAAHGTALQITASGPDSTAAADAIAGLVGRDFDDIDSSEGQPEPTDSV